MYFEEAIEAAHKGAKILKHYWGKLQNVQDKDVPGNLVTEADKVSEEAIVTHLRGKFPSHGILAEEGTNISIGHTEYEWVIDPLDGTVNYAHHFPHLAIAIALLRQGNPIVSVIFNPFSDELFTAVEGEGAFLNGQRLRVSQVESVTSSLLATGFSYDRHTRADNNYYEFSLMTHLAHGVRRAGAASLDLAFVAAGRVDGYWERGLQPWDMAAGLLLVTEAGGKVSAYDGSPVSIASGRVLATNGLLHEELSRYLMRAQGQTSVKEHWFSDIKSFETQ